VTSRDFAPDPDRATELAELAERIRRGEYTVPELAVADAVIAAIEGRLPENSDLRRSESAAPRPDPSPGPKD
jgi:hypothetical protein